MRDRRRMLLSQLGGASFAIPTFDGSHAVFGDEKKGYIECYSSGTITFPKAGIVDVFVLGSGLKGNDGATVSPAYQAQGGKGGKGAIGQTLNNIDVEGEYTITVGAACSSTTSANKSIAFGTTANGTRDNGGKGAVSTISGNSGSSSNAVKGTDGTSYPFGETSGAFYKKLGAGGGGGGTYYTNASNGYYGGQGSPGNGGTLGGGKGDNEVTGAGAGSANTGSGGGGGYAEVSMNSSGGYNTPTTTNGGNGGSGIVIVRWGYAA